MPLLLGMCGICSNGEGQEYSNDAFLMCMINWILKCIPNTNHPYLRNNYFLDKGGYSLDMWVNLLR
jgi:hypothetical protein